MLQLYQNGWSFRKTLCVFRSQCLFPCCCLSLEPLSLTRPWSGLPFSLSSMFLSQSFHLSFLLLGTLPSGVHVSITHIAFNSLLKRSFFIKVFFYPSVWNWNCLSHFQHFLAPSFILYSPEHLTSSNIVYNFLIYFVPGPFPCTRM